MRRRDCIPIVILLVAMLFSGSPALAQKNTPARVQIFTGTVNDSAEVVLYDLIGLQAGQTLYIYLEATSGSLDTYLGLGSQDFVRVLREDDDGGGDYNSALEYTLTENGDYQLAVTRYDASTAGNFRLVIGLDAPEALTGRIQAMGQQFATFHGTTARSDIELSGMGISFTDCSVLEERPRLSGREQTRNTRYFTLHYTTSGADAAESWYVDAVEDVLDTIWEREVSEMGWPAPPTDCGEGGDQRYDVYLMDTLSDSDALGYTSPDAILGDNPNSALEEGWASYSYLVIDNDFAGYDNVRALMRTTASHEFHHAIQFGYDVNDLGGYWFYEATATWMETQVFPEDEEATPYVSDLYATLDLCVGATPEDDRYSTRMYGEWLLIDSLAQDHGVRVVQRLWELIAQHEGMESLYVLAQELNTTPQEIIRRYAVRNLLRDYTLAPDFSTRVRVESLVSGIGQFIPRQSGVQELGVDYLLVTQPGVYSFEVVQPNLTMLAVGVDQKHGSADIYDLGKRATIDTRPYNYAYILLLNTDLHNDSDTCTTTEWVLTVSAGNPADVIAADPKIWNAPFFVPAR